MRHGELKIYYEGRHGRQLDDALIECLRQFGYKFWASGYDLEEGVRDLAFKQKSAQNEGVDDS